VIFCLPLLQNLVFRLSFIFCNLIFMFCLCNCFGISSSLQFLQFDICVQFLQFFLEWYFVFHFCKIWYFNFPSASVIWYLCFVFAIVLVFLLLFRFCNLVFAFSFCNFFWSDILSSASTKSGISTFLQLLQFDIPVLSLQLFWYFVFSSISAIWYLRSVSTIFLEWYFVFRFCKIWYFDFPLSSAIWYSCSVCAIVLIFRLLFSLCNLVFAFSFYNFFGVIFCLLFLQNLVFWLSFSFCHGIYYKRDCLVTLVTCWYETHPTPMYCGN